MPSVSSYTGYGGIDETAKVEEPRVVANWRARLSELGAGEELLNSLDGLWPALEAVFEENRILKEELTKAAEECAGIRGEAQVAQEFITLLEGDNEALEGRLRAAQESLRHAHSTTIEDIASQYPDVPQLFNLAQQLKQRKAKGREELQTLAARLPKSFTWSSERGTISYMPRFLHLLADISLDDQERFIRQLETLANQGKDYSSLYTRKYDFRVPFTPCPCFGSRGTDEWRFFWTKDGGVTVHWRGRKGDTRLRQSEA